MCFLLLCDGSDEVLYNETIHTDEDGIRCRNLLKEAGKIQECLLPKRYVRDGFAQCELGRKTLHGTLNDLSMKLMICIIGEDDCGSKDTFYCQSSPLGNEVQRQCIRRNFFCDGINECFDRSDEKM